MVGTYLYIHLVQKIKHINKCNMLESKSRRDDPQTYQLLTSTVNLSIYQDFEDLLLLLGLVVNVGCVFNHQPSAGRDREPGPGPSLMFDWLKNSN